MKTDVASIPANKSGNAGAGLIERAPAKRLSLNLSGSVYDELNALAEERRSTMTEIVRLALGLIKVVIREIKQGHKVVIAKADGQVLKELVLPE